MDRFWFKKVTWLCFLYINRKTTHFWGVFVWTIIFYFWKIFPTIYEKQRNIDKGYFFYYGRLSSAQLDHGQAPAQWPIIDQRLVEQTAYQTEIKDNGYKSVFTNSWLVRQRNKCWIKGLGKNQQKEWTRSLLAVPPVRGHRTMTPWTPRNNCVLTRLPPNHTKIRMRI